MNKFVLCFLLLTSMSCQSNIDRLNMNRTKRINKYYSTRGSHKTKTKTPRVLKRLKANPSSYKQYKIDNKYVIEKETIRSCTVEQYQEWKKKWISIPDNEQRHVSPIIVGNSLASITDQEYSFLYKKIKISYHSSWVNNNNPEEILHFFKKRWGQKEEAYLKLIAPFVDQE